MAKVSGSTHAARLSALDAAFASFAAVGCPGVFAHGFSTTMTPPVFAEYAALAKAHGLLCGAAFGMDASDPAGKGARVAKVAAMPECAALALDCEGAYDRGMREGVAAMAKAIRAGAPDALVLDQPWFACESHSGFPWREFAEVCSLRAPQVYVNDFKGADRYDRIWAWHARDWKAMEARLGVALTKPRIATVQAYGWQDIPASLERLLAEHETLIAWGEPFPSDQFMRALKARHELRCTPPPAAA